MDKNSEVGIENNQTEIDDNHFIINDIDVALYKYGLIYKYDVNNYFDTELKKRKQKFKYQAISVWLIFCACRSLISFRNNKDGKLPIYYFDIIQYFGGIVQFFYLIGIIAVIMGFVILKLLNIDNSIHFGWLDIIQVLKGIQNIDTIRIYDKEEWKKFAIKVKFILKIIENYIKMMKLFLMFMPISLLLLFDSGMMIIVVFISLLIFSGEIILVLIIVSYSFLYYFIVCSYCRIRFKSLNNKISKSITSRAFFVTKLVSELIEEQNNICNNIIIHDQFWRKYLFAITYSLIPMSLMILHNLLFEELVEYIFILGVMFTMATLFSQFMLISTTASINKESFKSYKLLVKFYLDNNVNLKLGNKIKV